MGLTHFRSLVGVEAIPIPKIRCTGKTILTLIRVPQKILRMVQGKGSHWRYGHLQSVAYLSKKAGPEFWDFSIR